MRRWRSVPTAASITTLSPATTTCLASRPELESRLLGLGRVMKASTTTSRQGRPAAARTATGTSAWRGELAVTRSREDSGESGAAKVFAFFRDKLLAGELKAGDRLLGERE